MSSLNYANRSTKTDSQSLELMLAHIRNNTMYPKSTILSCGKDGHSNAISVGLFNATDDLYDRSENAKVFQVTKIKQNTVSTTIIT